MAKMTFLVLLICGVVCTTEAANRAKFSAFVSDDFLYYGKSVRVTVTTVIYEPTPLKYKVMLPFNGTAYMRLLQFEMKVNDSLISITGSKTPNLTSSSNDADIIDILSLDMGMVTPTGTVTIIMSFYAQLLKHPQSCSCKDLWINIGAEFTNSSIWAYQHGIKGFAAINGKPVLNASITVSPDTVATGQEARVVVRVTHNPHKTTAEVTDAIVVVFFPSHFQHISTTKGNPKSVDFIEESSSPTARILRVNNISFVNTLEYNFTFKAQSLLQAGESLTAYFATQVHYNYSCTISDIPSAGSLPRPVHTSTKCYSPIARCEQALGVADKNIIADSKMRANSQGSSTPAHHARLNGAGEWVPASEHIGDYKLIFIEVNFDSLKEITRLDIQKGKESGSDLVDIDLAYSLDCVVWELHKNSFNDIRYFNATLGPNQIAVVPVNPSITAKCIRIQTHFLTKYGLRFEVYGCASNLSYTPSNLKSITYLVDPNTESVVHCHLTGYFRVFQSCYYVEDISKADPVFSSFPDGVHNVNFLDKTTKNVFGMGLGNTYYSCSLPLSYKDECHLISKEDYDQAKGSSDAVQAKNYDKITVTDNQASKLPVDADTILMKNGKKLGVSAAGIFYWDGSTWVLRISYLD